MLRSDSARHRRLLAGAAAVLTLTLGACTSGRATGDPAGAATSSATGGVSTSAPAVTPVPMAAQPPPSAATTCGAPEHPATPLWLPTADGALIDASVVGTSADVVVLLHQTNKSACGFWPYAAWLDSQGVRSVLVNFCGYGASQCPDGISWSADGSAAAAAAVAWARANGAQRVTLVGASVGGTVATVSAGSGTAGGPDAVVDLSGPTRYSTLDSGLAAPSLTVPALFAVAADDAVVPADQLKALAATAKGTPTRFLEVPAGGGHGWDLLADPSGWTDLALRIRAWAKGTYS